MYRLTVDNVEHYLVVLRQIFSGKLRIHTKYKLKGSTVDREASQKERAKDQPTYKAKWKILLICHEMDLFKIYGFQESMAPIPNDAPVILFKRRKNGKNFFQSTNLQGKVENADFLSL